MSTKISELPSGSALSGTEEVAIVQGGDTVKTTTQEIADLAGSSGATWGSITGTLSSQIDLNTALGNKVDKVTGKSLIDDTEISRLDSITGLFTSSV